MSYLGFNQSKQDYSLFTRSKDGEFLIILVYVDDMIVTGTSMSQIEKVKQVLDLAFTIKDLGELNYFLGTQITITAHGTFMSQKKYMNDILIDISSMEDCSHVSDPLSIGLKLSRDSGDVLEEPNIYRRLIGRMLYLGLTRPDISYVVQYLSQFMHSPRVPHLRADLHFVKYLKGTTNYGLYYKTGGVFDIHA